MTDCAIETFGLEKIYRSRFRGRAIKADDVLHTLQRHFDLRPDRAPRGSAPAELWEVDGGRGKVGIIASVSHAFCAACDRTRLTADGQIRNCLFARTESDLRTPLRNGASDAELAACLAAAVHGKLPGHGIDDPGFLQPARPMSAIGG